MRSPEFPPNLRWFNLPARLSAKTLVSAEAGSAPLQMKSLRGNHAVLVDFWTYSCVNCIRALPHIKGWHEKYAKFGLVIVGVHTPEFEFEKNVENVARAVKEFGIEYPVAMDNDYQIWSLYSNNVWPHEFLMNKDGVIVYDHAGEDAYAATEEAIRAALKEINPDLNLPATIEAALPSEASAKEGICLPVTPETYLGAMRGRPGRTWNFSGDWKIYPEYIEHEGKTEVFADYLTLNFEAAEVNLVMGAEGERAAKVRIELNGKPLNELEVHEPKMYNLLRGQKNIKGELRVFAKDRGLRVYAFTFGGCA